MWSETSAHLGIMHGWQRISDHWADVVLESFTPGVLESLELDHKHLKQRKHDIIMASTSILGQTGPHAMGTAGVGTCHGGTQVCTGGAWPTDCPGEVLPAAE